MNHFVYEPKKSTVNPQDIPFFLSVRLVDDANNDQDTKHKEEGDQDRTGESSDMNNAVAVLTQYEKNAAELATNFAENMVRY